jgi:fused signal recognition particle receptor
MTTPWYRRLSDGLSKSRDRLEGQINVILQRGPDVDDAFWEELEDALIASDMGMTAVTEIVDRLKDDATRKALPDALSVLDLLADELAAEFPETEDPLAESPLTVLVVGVNGTGKTTTVGKLAKQAVDERRSVLLGSSDTYRAAAGEQLDVWAERANVPIVLRERGSDPASVAFDAAKQASADSVDLTLIDTAGRLHTSTDLMQELKKVHRVTTAQSAAPVKTLLVMDATTGQNGLTQAREFDAALGLDGVILTKLDGTAKGGIVVAVGRDLGLPIVRVGVGEGIDDLRPFDAKEFAKALYQGA